MAVRRSGRWGAGEASYQGGAPHTVGPLDRAVSVSGFRHGFGQRVRSLGDQGQVALPYSPTRVLSLAMAARPLPLMPAWVGPETH